ncbi:hypothetical protein HPG69_014201 [Diceros bicornis minor]|uniref:Lipocalin/cytosolic fatty-acid binding domain-containing protein n=1 Tax=Diceros bicornis minor TaxID=77932 RepID=A0A7J7F6S4_DICBM|nr:hypothetical protein HPG69_014201 [Diceros bicornis minor]
MGPWRALCMALALMKALKGQTLNPQPAITPVLQSFQEDQGPRAVLGSAQPSSLQFQGEWFVLGLAGSTHRKADRSLLNPFTATFELNEKNRFEVSYAMTRGRRCVTWSYVLIPAAQPGKFSVDNSRVPGADPEEVQVYDTDYTTFALMLSRRQTGSQQILRVNLLCEPLALWPQMWAMHVQVLSKFVCLVRAQGLSGDNIVFPDLTGNRLPAGRPWTEGGHRPWASKALWGPCEWARPMLGVHVWGPGSPRGSA